VLDRSAPTFGHILSGLAKPEARPAVYHCSAGKDRTGLVTGVLLSTLGVGLDIIADDYEMTSQFRTAEHVRQTVDRLGRSQNLAPELVAGLLDAPRPAIVTALGELVSRHGSVESYLTGPGGAPPDLPERLRQALLD
jgi:protein-tyrosine phosphatase